MSNVVSCLQEPDRIALAFPINFSWDHCEGELSCGFYVLNESKQIGSTRPTGSAADDQALPPPIVQNLPIDPLAIPRHLNATPPRFGSTDGNLRGLVGSVAHNYVPRRGFHLIPAQPHCQEFLLLHVKAPLSEVSRLYSQQSSFGIRANQGL